MSTLPNSYPPTLLARPAPRVRVPAPTVERTSDAPLAQAIILGVFSASFGYALLRYVVLGTVSATQTPAYLLNKALAVAGTLLLALVAASAVVAARVPALARLAALRAPLGLAGFAMAAGHALLTMALLSPAYYPRIFIGSGKLTVWGELALATGLVSLALLVMPALTSFAGVRAAMEPRAWKRLQSLSVTALGLTGLHVAAMGWTTWTAASAATWPGGMPPLTLLSFAVVTAAFGARRLKKK